MHGPKAARQQWVAGGRDVRADVDATWRPMLGRAFAVDYRSLAFHPQTGTVGVFPTRFQGKTQGRARPVARADTLAGEGQKNAVLQRVTRRKPDRARQTRTQGF